MFYNSLPGVILQFGVLGSGVLILLSSDLKTLVGTAIANGAFGSIAVPLSPRSNKAFLKMYIIFFLNICFILLHFQHINPNYLSAKGSSAGSLTNVFLGLVATSYLAAILSTSQG